MLANTASAIAAATNKCNNQLPASNNINANSSRSHSVCQVVEICRLGCSTGNGEDDIDDINNFDDNGFGKIYR